MKLDSGLNRIAFFLIATLVALIVLSAIIPQQDYAEEQVLDWRELLGDAYAVVTALGLDRIYFTPFFFIVLGCLGVTLALGNIRRFHLVYRVEGTLLRARHLGSIIFHLALLLIMTGVILNYLFKFNGVFALTEGQSARDAATAYFRVFAGPLRAQANDRFRITLETVHNAFPVEASTTEAADIMVLPAAAATPLAATIRTNAPLAWNDLEFHFGSLTGFSPELHVSDTGGGTLFRGFVRLATRRVAGQREYADFVILPDADLKVGLKVDPTDPESIPARCRVTLERGHETLYDGWVAHADTVRYDNLTLTVPRMRRWCYIDVVENPFLSLVFVGFWTGLGGMVIGFVPRLIARKAMTA